MLKILTLICAFSTPAFADSNDAAARGALFTESVVCIPTKLVAVDDSPKKGMVLDLDKAATQLGAGTAQRAYKIPDSDVKVSFSMKYSAKQIEISKMYSKVTGKTEKLMMTFASPWTLDLPMPVGTTFVMQGGEAGSSIPPYEVECKLERKRIDNDCPDCR